MSLLIAQWAWEELRMNETAATDESRDLRDTRFYAILDTGYVPRPAWKAMAARLLTGGADLIQMRAKRESAAEREVLLQEVLELVAEWHGRRPHVILNDDVELCARYKGVGLHIGQDDMPAEEARHQIGPNRLLGLSTHSRAQATRAMAFRRGVLDYFCVGPVFATATKPDYEPVGLDLVRWAAEQQPILPWFCIGGINRSNVESLLGAGGRRMVAVSDVLLAEDPAAAVREFRCSITSS